MKDGLENLEFILVGKNRKILRLLVLTHYHRVTDRQTDTPPMPMSATKATVYSLLVGL